MGGLGGALQQPYLRLGPAVGVAICVIGVALDQASKQWATERLATAEHAILVPAAAADRGRAVSAVLVERGGAYEEQLEELESRGHRAVMRLRRELKASGESPAFHRPGTGYWVVTGATGRRLPAAGRVADDTTTHATSTIREYVAACSPFASSEALDALLESTYEVDHTRVRLSQSVEGDETFLLLERRVPLLPFVSLTYAENPGAGWGLFDDARPTWRRGGLLAVAGLALIVLAWLLWRLRAGPLELQLAFWSTAAGGLGNALDRIRLGYVVDFVDVHPFGVHWPTFNIADLLISVGAALLLVDAIRFGRRSLLLGGADAVVTRGVSGAP